MTQRTIAPQVRPFSDVRLDLPPLRHLSNGIPIYVIDRGSDEVNRLSVYVRGGVLDEPEPMLSLLTGAALVEGSSRFTSADIALRLDNEGAWKAVQAYDDWTELSFWSLNEHFASILEILTDCLTAPSFNAEDLAVLQRRYAGTCATQRQRGKYYSSLALRQMFYGAGHPLSRDTTPERILAITTRQLRSYYNTYYKTASMCVVLAGRVTDEMIAMTDASIGQMSLPGEAPQPYDWASFSLPQSGAQRIIHRPDDVQASIAIAIPAVARRHPDYFKLRLTAILLGGYFGSRLMTNIREDKGYTYGITAFLAGRAHCANVGINTECDVAHAMPVLDEVRREMRRLREEPVSQAELDIVKQNMISDLVKTLDTPFSVASYVASTITIGVYPEYYNEQVKQVMAATARDVMLMAERYLNEERMLVAIAAPEDKLVQIAP